MNHTRLIVVILCILAATSAYGQEWEYSMAPYDIRVYVTNFDSSKVITSCMSYVKDYRASYDTSDTVFVKTNTSYSSIGESQVFHPEDLLGRGRGSDHHYKMYRHPYGPIVSEHWLYSKRILVPNLLDAPLAKDTVLDYADSLGSVFKDFHTFDTTVYGRPLQAFAYTQCLKWDTVTVIVASPIGILRIIDQKSAREWYLSSAYIRGVSYNYVLRELRPPRYCDDYKIEFTTYHQDQNYYEFEISTVRDTVIQGTTYKYLFKDSKSGNQHQHQVMMVYRYQGDTLIEYRDSTEYVITYPKYSLGTVRNLQHLHAIPYTTPMAVDTGSVVINGSRKWSISFVNGGGSYFNITSYVQDVGRYKSYTYGNTSGPDIGKLTSFHACGDSIRGLEQFDIPPAWETPLYNHGDILVYEKKAGPGRALHRFGPVDGNVLPGSPGPDTVGVMSHFKIESGDPLPPPAAGWEPWTNTPGVSAVYINDDGVLMKVQDGGRASYPWFVARPPDVDTVVVLDTVWHSSEYRRFTDFSTFDTTVFNTEVKAFRYREAGSKSTIIVAEKFGVVRLTEEGCSECDWYLSSAVIDGVPYNYELKTVSMPRVCADLEAEYEVKTQEGQYSTFVRTVRDTIINGWQYHVYPMYGYDTFRYRNDEVLAYINGKDTLITPLQISLGTLISEDFMVTDTFSVLMNDGMHFGFSYGWYGNDNAWWTKWVDGVGKYEEATWAWSIGTGYTRLRRLTTCDTDYIVTSTEAAPRVIPSSPRIFSAPYPNPVSLGQGSVTLTSTQQLTQPVYITISDVLGRRLYTLRLEPTRPGTALRIPLQDIGPGLYYLSLNGATFSETTKLVVVR